MVFGMEFEINIDRNEAESNIWDIIVVDRLYIAILQILYRDKALDASKALSTPEIYRAIRREIDKEVRYKQIWKRLYRLLSYGVIEKVGENPIKWYIKKEYIDEISRVLSASKII